MALDVYKRQGLFDAESDMHDVVAILEQHPLLGAGFTPVSYTHLPMEIRF